MTVLTLTIDGVVASICILFAVLFITYEIGKQNGKRDS